MKESRRRKEGREVTREMVSAGATLCVADFKTTRIAFSAGETFRPLLEVCAWCRSQKHAPHGIVEREIGAAQRGRGSSRAWKSEIRPRDNGSPS